MADIKLVIVGDMRVGKTTFIYRVVTGETETNYVPTRYLHGTQHMCLYTNYGQVRFQCWDVSGDDAFAGSRDGYFVGAQCGIIMFDVTSRESFMSVSKWHREVTTVCGDIPIVLCGNKTDVNTPRMRVDRISLNSGITLPHFAMSVVTQTGDELEKPLQWLVRELVGKDVEFVEPHYNCPGDVVALSPRTMRRLEEEFEILAAAVVLLDEDEDL